MLLILLNKLASFLFFPLFSFPGLFSKFAPRFVISRALLFRLIFAHGAVTTLSTLIQLSTRLLESQEKSDREIGSRELVSFEIGPLSKPVSQLVIPAKAGTQSVIGAFPMACGLDSRFRGNDCTAERPRLANDTSTRIEKICEVGLCVTPIPPWKAGPQQTDPLTAILQSSGKLVFVTAEMFAASLVHTGLPFVAGMRMPMVWEKIWPGPALVGPLAARSLGLQLATYRPVSWLALALEPLEIDRHCSADEILQGRLIDLAAFVDVDGAPDITAKA